MNRRILTLLMVTAVIFAALPVGVTAQEGEGPAQMGLRPDAPPYALHGPYWVGTRDYVIPEGDSAFEVTVWYPALNPDGTPSLRLRRMWTTAPIRWWSFRPV
jgi:hypothetical protein